MLLLPAMLLQAQAGEGAEFLSMVKVLTPILLPSFGLMRLMLDLSQLWKMPLWEAISIPLHYGPLKLPQQDVDLDALRALANAAVTANSNIASSGTSQIPAASLRVSTAGPPGTFDVPPGTFDVPTGALTVPAGSLNVPTDVSASAASASVSSKGKSPMVEEDIPVKARTFKQMEEDRLGEEAAKRLHDEEIAQQERQRTEVQRKRQQDVIDSAMYYNEVDWLNIRA
nr:sm-like protein LSM7 [Tanacetum cinerariifolium]